MATYPNQKSVTINKAKSDKNNTYGIVNKACAQEASKSLKAGAFRLWVYFTLQQDSYTFDLSSKYLKDEWGINQYQYNSAVKELQEQGYLVPRDGLECVFDFYEDAAKALVGKPNKPCVETKQGNAASDDSLVGFPNKPYVETKQALCGNPISLVGKPNKPYVVSNQTLCGNQTRKITKNTRDYIENTGEYRESTGVGSDEPTRRLSSDSNSKEKPCASHPLDFRF